MVVKDGPSGDLFVNLAKDYPGQDLIMLNAMGTHVFVANSRLMADILVHNCYDFAKPARIRAFLRYILGDGLIIIEGDQHKFVRKNTTPAFHFRHIKDLYPLMWSKAEILTEALKHEVDSNPSTSPDGSRSGVVELTPWASKVTLDIIGVAGMGRNLNTIEKASNPMQEAYEGLLEPSREKLAFGMLGLGVGRPLLRLLPWKMNQTFDRLTGTLNNICRPMVTEKRDALEKGDEHFDILSILIKTNNFSDEALKDQLLTFLAAGYAPQEPRPCGDITDSERRHETTASALTWACYLLAKRPDLQERLREEVRQGVPAELVAAPTADLAGALEQLPYLNGVIHETLRLYPTVPLTMREALRDTHVGDQFVPQGTNMIISIWHINRSPAVWGPSATEFRPERWIGEDGRASQNGGAGSNYDFLTFLHGPRSCIGQSFAKAEMRCLLATMVLRFSWELAMDDGKVVPRGVITIKPENGMFLRLTPLDKGEGVP